MAVFEVESFLPAEGKEQEMEEAMQRWLRWVHDHRELFSEWKSVRYFQKHVAGEDSNRYLVMWEYESYAAFEAYKARRKDYEGPYAEYKENDPYYKDVFIHSRMGYEFWRDKERELWIE